MAGPTHTHRATSGDRQSLKAITKWCYSHVSPPRPSAVL